MKKPFGLFFALLFCLLTVVTPTNLMADGNPTPCGQLNCRPPALALDSQVVTAR